MNYAAPICGSVMLMSTVWFYAGGNKFYHGPRNIIAEERAAAAASALNLLAGGSPSEYK